MQYLCIQNPGEAPVEGWTTLGVSTTRYDGTTRTIGQFGSGNKQSINLLLRMGIQPIVYCGLTRLEFFTEKMPVNDGLTEHDFHKVMCRITGKIEDKSVNRVVDCGFTTEYGVQDWNNIDMALREFISNAIDRTERQEGDFQPSLKNGHLSIFVVNQNKVRAKAGFTRVYVPYITEVIRYHSELGKRFLHFSEPENLDRKLLPKKNRNFHSDSAVIYKNGVFVREVADLPSIFDYNFSSELELDESRNVNDWRVKEAAGYAFRDAEAQDLATIFRSLMGHQEYWEHDLERNHLSTRFVYDTDKVDRIKENWKSGWELAAGTGVMCSQEMFIMEIVEKKGYHAVPIRATSWLEAANIIGSIPTYTKIISSHEASGITLVPPTDWALKSVNMVWQWLESAKLTFGKSKPKIECFEKAMSAGQTLNGFYNDDTVYINKSCADNGINKFLLKVALEEVAHHITDATDMSRDFQDYLLKLVVELCLNDPDET